MRILRTVILPAVTFLLAASALSAQTAFPDGRLDPTRNSTVASQPFHPRLPEQYIWTAGDITARRSDWSDYPWNRTDLRAEPHFFRAHFHVTAIPRAATLYIAGPREAHVYLNGHLLAEFTSNIDAPINFHVFHIDATPALKLADNVIAIEAIRGRAVSLGAASYTTQQIAYGEVLVAKIVPAAFGAEAPPLISTDAKWRSSAARTANWQEPTFDDRDWPAAASLGPIEGDSDLFQWNADAGMYAWPGYMGMSDSLRNYSLLAQAVTHIYPAHSKLTNLAALTQQSVTPFTITLPHPTIEAESPSLLLDFGREVSGRLFVESACDCTAALSIAYGESEIEAMSTGLTSGRSGGNYLGTNILEVPPRGTARGPKSGFRYVRITFLRGAPLTAFKSIRLEGIYYPVDYAGHFQSSDPLLNRIWETGAYTAHLCMQDGIWDAIKRDRGRWAGDLDVAGRVISTVFADKQLIEDTLRNLVPEGTGPVSAINGIPGYSAQWIAGLYSLYLHSGDKDFLVSQHDNLLRILAGMDATLDSTGILAPNQREWLFVDWAPGLNGGSPEARIGTQLQYLRAYKDAVRLLTWLGDAPNKAKYEARLNNSMAATEPAFRNPETGGYGTTWQVNSLAALTIADPKESSIWNNVLSRVKQDSPSDPIITPYFNSYVIDAMASLGHRREALNWMRQYWGGMLAEDATSFWEGYDLRWPKSNPHLSLQADNTSGYFVSLAHGWSSGPTAWLAENILGVTPIEPGYDSVDIHPDLVDLTWAYGSVPIPHGLIKVNIDKQRGIILDLPRGVATARLSLASFSPNAEIYLNGRNQPRGSAQSLELTGPGHYEITAHAAPPPAPQRPTRPKR
jgi:alpha-L-rhamnosidase